MCGRPDPKILAPAHVHRPRAAASQRAGAKNLPQCRPAVLKRDFRRWPRSRTGLLPGMRRALAAGVSPSEANCHGRIEVFKSSIGLISGCFRCDVELMEGEVQSGTKRDGNGESMIMIREAQKQTPTPQTDTRIKIYFLPNLMTA